MKTALITLSAAGARLLAPLAAALPESQLYVHESVRDLPAVGAPAPDKPATGAAGVAEAAPNWRAQAEPGQAVPAFDATGCPELDPNGPNPGGPGPAGPPSGIPAIPAAERFAKVASLTKALFPVCRGLVFAAPCGVVVRAIAPLVKNKLADPGVVVIDAGGRWAVSLLSGHEGGANELALRVANLIGAEPVITTTTEALKSVIVGIGCRRGTKAARIVAAVQGALAEEGVALSEVRLLASADLKADEPGLLEAAEALDVPLRFIPASEIRASSREFAHSDIVYAKVKLPAVAEPAALLAGRRTQFICRKKTYPGITIAIAREGFSWSASAPEAR